MIGRDLLGIEDLDREDIERFLHTAEHMREVGERIVKKVPTLRGRTIVNLFFEPSTRTRASFEIAGKRLSADVINFSPDSSSLKKAESILDTARTLDAMDPDAVVVRHGVAGVPKQIADVLSAPVINAGDGAHEHPTQALLDLLTVKLEKGRIEGLTIAIVGDILHSRVARSNSRPRRSPLHLRPGGLRRRRRSARLRSGRRRARRGPPTDRECGPHGSRCVARSRISPGFGTTTRQEIENGHSNCDTVSDLIVAFVQGKFSA